MSQLLLRKWLVDPHYVDQNGETDCGIVTDNGYSICRCPKYMTKNRWDALAPAIASVPTLLRENRTLRKQVGELVEVLKHANHYLHRMQGTDSPPKGIVMQIHKTLTRIEEEVKR